MAGEASSTAARLEAVRALADSDGNGVYVVCNRCEKHGNGSLTDDPMPSLAVLTRWAETHDCT